MKKMVLLAGLSLISAGLFLACGEVDQAPGSDQGISGPDAFSADANYATTRPDTFINSNPPDPSSSTDASFPFSCNKKRCAFQCKLDSSAWKSCKSPKNYTNLGGGLHTFRVKAQNPANDLWDKSPASYSWTIGDIWIPTSTPANVPSPRDLHTAVLAGTKMIVWGGFAGSPNYFKTGGRYNPANNSWTPTFAGANIPSARYRHTAVWTGNQMIVWGGDNGSYLNSGGIYNPTTNSWTPTSTGANVPVARSYHTAVWAGNQMIVWGGQEEANYFNTGARYNPATNSWTPTSTGTNVPSGRRDHTTVWTGTEMIVWGGYMYDTANHYLNDGGRYNSTDNSWLPTSTGTNVPSVRSEHSAVWASTQMIVWGGYMYDTSGHCLNDGGRYNPADNSWLPTSTGANVPSERNLHTAVWTGSDMIVWGGSSGGYLNTGGKYNPGDDDWHPTSTGANVPTARAWFTAIWTGNQMIIWGGYDGSNFLNTGARYWP